MKVIIVFLLWAFILGGCSPEKKEEFQTQKPSVPFRDKELDEWRKVIYQSRERLDFSRFNNPFVEPKISLQTAMQTEAFVYELKGIIHKANKKYALLQNSEKKGFTVTEKTRLGKHLIKTIGNDYIIVIIEEIDMFGSRNFREMKLTLKKE